MALLDHFHPPLDGPRHAFNGVVGLRDAQTANVLKELVPVQMR